MLERRDVPSLCGGGCGFGQIGERVAGAETDDPTGLDRMQNTATES